MQERATLSRPLGLRTLRGLVGIVLIAAWLGAFYWFHRVLQTWLDTSAVHLQTYNWASGLATCTECVGVSFLGRLMLRLAKGQRTNWTRSECKALRVLDVLCITVFLAAVVMLWWSLRRIA